MISVPGTAHDRTANADAVFLSVCEMHTVSPL